SSRRRSLSADSSGYSLRYVSTRTRSPRDQRRSRSARTTANTSAAEGGALPLDRLRRNRVSAIGAVSIVQPVFSFRSHPSATPFKVVAGTVHGVVPSTPGALPRYEGVLRHAARRILPRGHLNTGGHLMRLLRAAPFLLLALAIALAFPVTAEDKGK